MLNGGMANPPRRSYAPPYQRRRDHYTCQGCGKTEVELGRVLDVHHIRPFREFGYIRHQNDRYLLANDLSNLVSLCVSCHKTMEWKTESSL
jgi:hypothetical protein